MINYKDITKSNSKKCLMCGEENGESGITILKNFICEDCISEINKLKVNDKRYHEIKDKLKGVLINYL